MANLILSKQTMSSIEIAELTGKEHKNVLRDIRNLLNQGVNQLNFEPVEYKDAKGEMRIRYELTRKGSLILASGYNALLREKIIDRWEELETGNAEPISKHPLSPSELLLRQAQILVENEKKIMALEDKTTELRTEVEEIKQRTTTDLHQSTIVAFVSRNNIKLEVNKYGAMGKKASSICKKRGIAVTKIHDVRWGMVSVYPDPVLEEVFNFKQVSGHER